MGDESSATDGSAARCRETTPGAMAPAGTPSDPGLDSHPELTLAVGEELPSRARDVARGVDDRVRRALGSPDRTGPAPA